MADPSPPPKKRMSDSAKITLGLIFYFVSEILPAISSHAIKRWQRKKSMATQTPPPPGPPPGPPTPAPSSPAPGKPKTMKRFSVGRVFGLLIGYFGSVGVAFFLLGPFYGMFAFLGLTLFFLGALRWATDLAFDAITGALYCALVMLVPSITIGGLITMVLGIGGTTNDATALSYLATLHGFLLRSHLDVGSSGAEQAVRFAQAGPVVAFIAALVGFSLDNISGGSFVHRLYSGFHQVKYRIDHGEIEDEQVPGELLDPPAPTKGYHRFGYAVCFIAGLGGMVGAATAYGYNLIGTFACMVLCIMWILAMVVVLRDLYKESHKHDTDLRIVMIGGALAAVVFAIIGGLSIYREHDAVARAALKRSVDVRERVACADEVQRIKARNGGTLSQRCIMYYRRNNKQSVIDGLPKGPIDLDAMEHPGLCRDPNTMLHEACVDLALIDPRFAGWTRAEIIYRKQIQSGLLADSVEAAISNATARDKAMKAKPVR